MRSESTIVTRRLLTALSLLLLACGSSRAATRIENTVTISDPTKPSLHVSTVITGLNQPQIELGIPVWAPGHYAVDEFARNIARLVFTDESGRVLHHEKNTGSIWIVKTSGVKTLKIEFDYQAEELDMNKSKVNPTYAILNGANFLFYIKDHTMDIPESITYRLPPDWSLATPLAATAESATFAAENYDTLVDAPALVGQFDVVTFSLRGVPHRLAVAPKAALSPGALQKVAEADAKVIDAHANLFGELPYKQYLIINVFEGDRDMGALEHQNSYFAIEAKMSAIPEVLLDLAELTAHEFFHVYNVKRIRPADMWPYRYDERNYTRLLWFAEGVTQYYTPRGLLRAGLRNRDEYLQTTAYNLGAVREDEPGKYISLEEASINTWVGSRSFGEGQFFYVDYYARGAAIGLLLDLSIRHDTRGAANLDDVLRALYQNYYLKHRGYTSADLLAVINQLTKKDYREFLDRKSVV